jgi:elongation of very long chain fatty acids protein 4
MEFVHRLTASVPQALADLDARVASGSQPQFGLEFWVGPEWAWIDFFNPLNVQGISTICATYLFLVWAVSKFSASFDAPVFGDLRRVIQLYNLICVALAGYVVVGIVQYKLGNPGTFVCNPIDTGNEKGDHLAFVIWVYYAQKYFELLDTFFFILRQRWRQLSFLHVYHHVSIPMVTAFFLAFDVNADSVVTAAVLNSSVHVLMYSHYFLSSLGVPTPWRKMLTKCQLLQFCVCFVQPAYAFYVGPDCGYPDFMKIGMLVYQLSMIVLFSQFYSKSYKAAADAKKAKSK